MNNKNIKGFTLAEVLMCLAIIGVIMAISVQSIRVVKASYTALTYFTYRNVQEMIVSIFSGSVTNDDIKRKVLRKCRNTNGEITRVIRGVDSDNVEYCNALTGEQSEYFCLALANVVNTAGKINCSKQFNIDKSTGEPMINIDYATEEPTFKTTNGMRYYISKWEYNSSISNKYGYRVMAVDLNGTSKPNIHVAEGKKYPDVVTFVIFDNGEIFPVGPAADNLTLGSKSIKYLTTVVKGYYYDNTNTDRIAESCKTPSGQALCSYAVVKIEDGSRKNIFSYRQAYCATLGNSTSSSTYNSYCSKASIPSGAAYCPPSTSMNVFDACEVELIKPMFRYNFK